MLDIRSRQVIFAEPAVPSLAGLITACLALTINPLAKHFSRWKKNWTGGARLINDLKNIKAI